MRTEIESLPRRTNVLMPSRSPFRLLVLGGSLGAQALNEIVPARWRKSESRRSVLKFMHQTGEKHFDRTQKAICINGDTGESYTLY